MSNLHLKNKFDLVVIGCSVGGIEALKIILSDIPKNFNVPIVIVQHRSPDSNSMMIRYFTDLCPLTVCEPEDKEPIEAGKVYFAPANYHLLLAADHRFNLSVDEPVFYSRPSIDVTFKSAAEIYNNRLIGFVLSGSNADGARGLKEIKDFGGFTVVQNSKTAYQSEMPLAAIEMVGPDLILDLKELKELIHDL